MKNHRPGDQTKIVALRVMDLRSEFEAQLRAVSRLEDQLRKTRDGVDVDGRALADAIRRELAEMLNNNANIRSVLHELASDAPPSHAVKV